MGWVLVGLDEDMVPYSSSMEVFSSSTLLLAPPPEDDDKSDMAATEWRR